MTFLGENAGVSGSDTFLGENIGISVSGIFNR
jgi:hypothetical protein